MVETMLQDSVIDGEDTLEHLLGYQNEGKGYV